MNTPQLIVRSVDEHGPATLHFRTPEGIEHEIKGVFRVQAGFYGVVGGFAEADVELVIHGNNVKFERGETNAS